MNFPTGTNEEVLSSSSLYIASSKLRAYLLLSTPFRFNKLTPLSYVNNSVNLYILYNTYSQKVIRCDCCLLHRMDLVVAGEPGCDGGWVGYSGDGGWVEGTVVMEGGWRDSGDGGWVEVQW